MSNLFRGHNSLIQGFNTFLPQGYHIECSSDPTDPNPIRVTTPQGTTSRPDCEPVAPYIDGRWQQGQEQYSSYYPGGVQQQQQQQPSQQLAQQQQQSQQQQQQEQQQQEQQLPKQQQQGDDGNLANSMSQLHAAANGTRPTVTPDARRPGDPVEFNHAISYVNKIKTRFASQPDIYRTFLEILQTYQREQLRISEVYTQVTLLFREAPDLLNDFRQFLPDMSQQAAQDQNEVKLPPVGNFAPPTQMNSSMTLAQQQAPSNENFALPTPSGKGKKRTAEQQSQNGVTNYEDGSQTTVKPKKAKRKTTAQAKSASAKNDMKEEHTLFDKIKKALSAESLETFYDTIQLFYTQSIDLSVLVEQVEKLLKGSPDIIKLFKKYVGYKGPVNVENVPYSSDILEYSQVPLSNDQSYRNVLKSEAQMPCSGRDEMCWEVLNDEWVSQYTRQPAKSGFKTRRRNQYEEILNNVEEERHEYDYYIEANLRTMQTLESITNRIANMTPEEKNYFKLPPNLGHTSTVYEKVLKKIYGDQRYQEVVDALRETPSIAVPVVLRRLRQKDEEWKRGLREWNKVWRNIEENVYYKSLDHQGLIFKEDDKIYLDSRSIISEIIDLKTARENSTLSVTSANTERLLVAKIDDEFVLKDIFNLLSVFIQHKNDYNDKKRTKLTALLKNLMILIFSLPNNFFEKSQDSKNIFSFKSVEEILKHTEKVSLKSLLENAQKTNLSIESTQQLIKSIPLEGKVWLQNLASDENLSNACPYITVDPLFANATIYIFVRLITVFYQRLSKVKNFETIVSKEIGSGIKIQHGFDFGFIDDRLDSLNLKFTGDNVYGQLLKYIQKLFEGIFSTEIYEEIVRQSYKNRAVELYTIENLVTLLVVYLEEISINPKAAGLILLNEQYREQGKPTVKSAIAYRTKALSLTDPVTTLFQINFNRETKEISFELLEDQLTYDDEIEAINQWTRYVSEFSISEPTPNVPVESVKLPFLNKSLQDSTSLGDLTSIEKLGIKICPKTYKLFFDAKTEEFFAKNGPSSESKTMMKQNWFKKFFDGPKGWRADLNKESQLEAEGKFDAWTKNGPDAMNAWQPLVEPIEKEKMTAAVAAAENLKLPAPSASTTGEENTPEKAKSSKPLPTEAKTETEIGTTDLETEELKKEDVEMKDAEPKPEKEDVEMKEVESESEKVDGKSKVTESSLRNEDLEMKDIEPEVPAKPIEEASATKTSDDTTETTAKLTTETLTETATKTPTKPVTEPITEPATKTATETVDEVTAEFDAKSVTEPATDLKSSDPISQKPVSSATGDKLIGNNTKPTDPEPEPTPSKPEAIKETSPVLSKEQSEPTAKVSTDTVVTDTVVTETETATQDTTSENQK